MMLKRQCIESHLAKECPCHCQYCGFTGRKIEIATRHKKQCSQYPLPCPNGCELGVVPTAGMFDHKKVCPLEIVSCEYHDMGCNVRIPRKDLEDHNTTEMAQHLKLMNQALVAMSQDLSKAKSMQEVQYEDITNMLASSDDKLCAAIAEIDASKVTQVKQDENLKELHENFDISAMIIIVVFLVFVIALIAYATYTTIMLNKSDNHLWRLSLQQESCLDMCTDGEAPVIIKMTNFTEMKKNKEDWQSSPFLAFQNGYLMNLRVNAFGDGSHVMAALQLLKGPHDDELERNGFFPMQLLASVELLNQVKDYHHHLVPVMFEHHMMCAKRVVWKTHFSNLNIPLISHSKMTNQDAIYLHNNQLHFRVSIILIKQEYFTMILYYYYYYIVGSKNLIWKVLTNILFLALTLLIGLVLFFIIFVAIALFRAHE